MALTENQSRILEIMERVSSVLSLLGTSFIILTFLTSRMFRKPINRLVFYASFANTFTNVSTLIARDGIKAGPNSALCQMQGFLIQWFMYTDPLFTLMMAFNVYLTFFRRYSGDQLRAMEWKYLLFCYGVPFVPAFAYFFVRDSTGDRVYGPASLWCWIAPDWKVLRIASFYGPIWVCIVITMAIYIGVGVEIFRKRRQLREFSISTTNPIKTGVSTKVNEVRVTREVVTSLDSRSASPLPRSGSERERQCGSKHDYRQYSVTIDVGDKIFVGPQIRSAREAEAATRFSASTNDVAWSYARAALAYFVAMVVTWVPSSTYRVHGLLRPNSDPFAFVLISSIVLPLQGFWNALIYIIVSQSAVRTYFRHIFDMRPFRRLSGSYPAGSGA